MKNTITKAVSLLTVLFSSTVWAVAPGAYTQFDVGLGNTQVKSSGTHKTSSNTGIGGGAAIGYQFSNYGAFDLGYTHWANGTSTAVPTCGSAVIHNDSINFMGKGILGIYGFNVFGKGGLGVLRSSGGGSCASGGGKATNTVKPILGVGIGYDVSQTTVVELTYTRLFANTKQISNLNLLSLGISYHFVDIYCGQFLA